MEDAFYKINELFDVLEDEFIYYSEFHILQNMGNKRTMQKLRYFMIAI